MSEIENKKSILIIGIAGGLAQITARLILQHHPDWEIVGVDSRDTRSCMQVKGLRVISMRYSRGNFEKLFRENHFDVVYHLGRISHSSNGQGDLERRLELSVMGTNRILDLCYRFGAEKVIILSTFHVYGALPDNSIFIHEEMPLRAALKYPELRDVIEMDQICTNWMWKFQNKVSTVVLRPCNIIGNQIQNTMSRFLTAPWALKPIDFNPVFQFIHEFDMASVLYRTMTEVPTGIYNVATNEYIPLRKALRIVGNQGIPFPISLAETFNKFLKVAKLEVPEYLVDYLKYSCLVDNLAIRKHLGDDFYRFSIEDTLKLLKLK